MLDPQFAYIGELRIANRVGIRPGECRTRVFEHAHGGIDAILFFDRQAVPPFAEFIAKFDLSSHILTM
jgi:hypothetical protein